MLMKAISTRQPWAWAIIYGGKDVENRSRFTNYRGPILIHASKTFDQEGFEWMLENQARLGIKYRVPLSPDFQRGGIIGKAILTKCVRSLDYSPWMFGPWGYVLENPEPLPFYPCKGQVTIPFEIDYAPGRER